MRHRITRLLGAEVPVRMVQASLGQEVPQRTPRVQARLAKAVGPLG